MMNDAIQQTLEDANRIAGNQPMWALKNMVIALSLLPALNTPEENKRLAAAKFILKHKKK